MPTLLQRYATPLVTGLFLVSLISGVALFFHAAPALFHGMHEWLSMVLILPFILHAWKNWRPLAAYFRKPAFALALLLSAVLAAPFALQSAAGGGPPQMALAHALFVNTANEIAPLLKTSPETLVGGLKAAGFTTASADQPLADIAKASGKTDMELAAALNRAGLQP
ncbi:DUF4405 domain-containing protein [Aestuariivirga sp.]|uniref:DUF4405 domain-containing protein n=1 Tax=Aestuariivirga sp. TaxID=2650926 RepID=UPI003918AD08